jgi:hypothetical protein
MMTRLFRWLRSIGRRQPVLWYVATCRVCGKCWTLTTDGVAQCPSAARGKWTWSSIRGGRCGNERR